MTNNISTAYNKYHKHHQWNHSVDEKTSLNNSPNSTSQTKKLPLNLQTIIKQKKKPKPKMIIQENKQDYQIIKNEILT